jgi:hypothetical protein
MQGLNQARAKDTQAILAHVRGIATRFAQERSERQRRCTLVQVDLCQLREAGFLLVDGP